MNWNNKKVLVLGDIMMDKFIYGHCSRLSPDGGPVPVIDIENEACMPGGAANVAGNIELLGGIPHLMGLIGNDTVGINLRKTVNDGRGSVLLSSERSTLVKTRIICDGHPVIRLDRGTVRELSAREECQIIDLLKLVVPTCDAVVVSDYAKGVINHKVMAMLNTFRRAVGIPLVIDPKPKNIACYRVQPDIIIPNADELSQITNVHVRDYRASILSVLQMTGAKAVLVTKGKEGMTLFLADKMDGRLTTWEQKEISPLKGIKSKWTAGAGDVVAAVMGLSLASGYSFLAASEFANMAAAISTEKPTTCNCSIEELRERF